MCPALNISVKELCSLVQIYMTCFFLAGLLRAIIVRLRVLLCRRRLCYDVRSALPGAVASHKWYVCGVGDLVPSWCWETYVHVRCTHIRIYYQAFTSSLRHPQKPYTEHVCDYTMLSGHINIVHGSQFGWIDSFIYCLVLEVHIALFYNLCLLFRCAGVN